jgi:MHS family proline/betaine transporter-like MFS transporter
LPRRCAPRNDGIRQSFSKLTVLNAVTISWRISMQKIANYRAALIGNIVELFDFFNYAYFAPIIAVLFFPNNNKVTSLILTYSVFAVGFIARPLGGAILGRLGDKLGRKKVLLASIIFMGIPTCLIGILPTYAHWGISASLIMILLRIAQGLAAGGELGGSMIYLVEHAPVNRRGFIGSFAMLGVHSGVLLSAFVSFLLTTKLTSTQLYSWGWRIPFLLGGVFALSGYFLRKSMHETPVFEQTHNTLQKKKSLSIYLKEILHVAKYNIITASCFYLLLVYLVSYLKDTLHLSLSYALGITTLNLLVVITTVPFWGYLSDIIGRIPILLSVMLSFLFFSYPLFMMTTFSGIWPLLIALFIFSFLLSALTGLSPVLVTECVPPESRYFSISIGYSLSSAIFGSSAPILLVWLSQYYPGAAAPALYLSMMAGVSLIVIAISDGWLQKLATYSIFKKEIMEVDPS